MRAVDRRCGARRGLSETKARQGWRVEHGFAMESAIKQVLGRNVGVEGKIGRAGARDWRL